MKTFHFENETVLQSLRIFLECFKLPGEAQQIDKIVEVKRENSFRHLPKTYFQHV